MPVLTAYWDLEGDSVDHIGSYNGSDTNITYGEEYGVISQGALFNGSTSKITITDASALKPTTFTVGSWVKTTASVAYAHIFQSYSANVNQAGLEFRLNDAGTIPALLIGPNTGSGTNSSVTAVTTINDGNWHLVIATCVAANYISIFVDGNHEGKTTTSYTPTYAATNYVRIGAGNLSGSDSWLWSGSLDEVFLINGTALTPIEIFELYNGSYIGRMRL